jgi:exonuclease VII small subunit
MLKQLILLSGLSIITLSLVTTEIKAQTTTPEINNTAVVTDQQTETLVNTQAESESQRPDSEDNQSATVTETRDERRLDQRTQTQTDRQELRSTRQQTVNEVRQQRIKNLAANLSNRLEAAIARLFQIVDRIESRLIKLESNGVDISAAQTSLRRASANLAEARSQMQNIDQAVNDATTSNTPLLAWTQVKERYTRVAQLIRQAHSELRQSLAEAKRAVIETESGPSVSEVVRSNNDLSDVTE